MLKKENRFNNNLIFSLKYKDGDLNININELIYKIIKNNPNIQYQNRKKISELIKKYDF